jgi:PAS domain S-box-containing protein
MPVQFEGESGLLFEQAMAQTRMAICLTDPNLPDHPLVFCNAAFERLTGYTSEEIVGRNCRFLQGAETDPEQVRRIREALRDEQAAVFKILNYRKDGSTFWNGLHLGPLYNWNGSLKYFFASQWVLSDIHEARAEERHAKAMAREVSHRLKNDFAVIGGIVTITGRAMNSRKVARRINERIQALGRSYEPTLDEAVLGTTEVGQAVKAVLQPYDPEGDRIGFGGDAVRAEPNLISAVGLTLHELATNATKYGALSDNDGRVQVNWKRTTDRFGRPALTIGWKETGGPAIIEEPAAGGTGFEIVEALLSHSRGSFDRMWEPDGLRAELSFPIA